MTRLEKILNNLPPATIEEMKVCTPTDLKSLIVSAEQAIADAKQQLEDNSKYQELKENLKACTAGTGELKKYQGAKIQFALVLLSENGGF